MRHACQSFQNLDPNIVFSSFFCVVSNHCVEHKFARYGNSRETACWNSGKYRGQWGKTLHLFPFIDGRMSQQYCLLMLRYIMLWWGCVLICGRFCRRVQLKKMSIKAASNAVSDARLKNWRIYVISVSVLRIPVSGRFWTHPFRFPSSDFSKQKKSAYSHYSWVPYMLHKLLCFDENHPTLSLNPLSSSMTESVSVRYRCLAGYLGKPEAKEVEMYHTIQWLPCVERPLRIVIESLVKKLGFLFYAFQEIFFNELHEQEKREELVEWRPVSKKELFWAYVGEFGSVNLSACMCMCICRN